MRLGNVIGRVTLSQAVPQLAGARWLIVSPFTREHFERDVEASETLSKDPSLVVYDNLGGGVGQDVARMHQAIVDVRLCMDVAESRPELDTSHGVILVGYSMGSVFDAVAGPADPRVKAMCLMVGGTIDFPPIFTMVPQLAAIQPYRDSVEVVDWYDTSGAKLKIPLKKKLSPRGEQHDREGKARDNLAKLFRK